MGRAVALVATAMVLLSAAPQPVSAQNLFEALFGGFNSRREMPPRVSSYADPRINDARSYRRAASPEHTGSSSAYSSAPSSGFCVRTCDGRYFAVRSTGGMSAAELCKSFCPAAATKIFSGSKIDYSVAPDGTRYADLDNAFLYRERRVDNCTCNGTDPYGLATLDPQIDPTLRPGDIVATNDGLAVFNGNRSNRTADFTPISQMGGSSEWRQRLMAIKVTPAPPRATPTPVEEPKKSAERTDRRRVQR